MSQETPIYIEDEIKASYLDYSMSVIVSRALPDVRDGMKPVHRRILFAMNELGMSFDKPHKKSARIVGEVLGKYHPHGDTAVYNSMVRMAQDFNYRYPLINGHGNFGSVDGDSAAAMRYTEARMSKIAGEILADIEKNTIDYRKNFDDTLDEPIVLPAKVPNLLLNGAAGIAVGMATNIPPHNLCELVDGIIAVIENKDINSFDLIQHVKGPDFPTGGAINGVRGIHEAYTTGRGKVLVRGKAEIEEMKGGKEAIIIKELPYQVNKARLIERIAELVKEKRLTGITDLRDESDRDGIRVVIELKKGENNQIVLNNLFKHTDLQVTFGIIMLALVNNVPRVLTLKQMLQYFIEHRFEVVTRRTKFELDKAEKRAHILEGFKIALDHIDEVISIIRSSKEVNEAKDRLKERFLFSEEQAKAILEMRLQRLTGLEREKIEEEYRELLLIINELRAILADNGRIYGIIKSELLEIKSVYGDKRRTDINPEASEIDIEDLIKDEQVIVTVTNNGYIKRMLLDKYKAQKRGGKGIAAHSTTEEDFVEMMYSASNLDTLLIFTNKGKVYNIKVYEIPENSRQARGKLISNLISTTADSEKVRGIIKVREFSEDNNIIFITRKGIVKRTSLDKFNKINKAGIISVNLREDDDLIFAGITTGNNEILLATRLGYSIRFNEQDAREMGRAAMGVKGIKLRKGDEVVSGMVISNPDSTILTITERGYGKRTKLEEYSPQNRGGLGIINIKINEKLGKVVEIKEIAGDEELMVITSKGTLIRTTAESVPIYGRASQGVIVMKVDDEEKVVSIVKVIQDEIEIFEE